MEVEFEKRSTEELVLHLAFLVSVNTVKIGELEKKIQQLTDE